MAWRFLATADVVSAIIVVGDLLVVYDVCY